MIDLHTHSHYSDGTDAPANLMRSAYDDGLRIVALTDHDCTDGLPEAREAAAKLRGFEVIPGIELSCELGDREVHVLGYFLDTDHAPLQWRLAELREARRTRADRILDRLDKLGLTLDRDRVREIAGSGAFGRPHIARALMEAGHVDSINEAFDRYLARDRPAYVERLRLTIPEAIALIRQAGGAASIAHPWALENLDGLLTEAKDAGLAGLEAHYGRYDAGRVEELAALAARHGLVATGGSDYHGANKPDVTLGCADVPVRSVTQLRKRAG